MPKDIISLIIFNFCMYKFMKCMSLVCFSNTIVLIFRVCIFKITVQLTATITSQNMAY
jgi:hypothetical protein